MFERWRHVSHKTWDKRWMSEILDLDLTLKPTNVLFVSHETTGAWAAWSAYRRCSKGEWNSRSGGTLSQLEVDIQVVSHRIVWKTGLEKTTNRLVLMVVICRFFFCLFFVATCFFCFCSSSSAVFSSFWSYVTSNITAWSHVASKFV